MAFLSGNIRCVDVFSLLADSHAFDGFDYKHTCFKQH